MLASAEARWLFVQLLCFLEGRRRPVGRMRPEA